MLTATPVRWVNAVALPVEGHCSGAVGTTRFTF